MGTPRTGRRTHPRLSAAQVREIRHLLASGAKHADIAKMFRITPGAVNDISLGKTWQDVK